MCEGDNKDLINKVQEGGCPNKGTDKCKGACTKIIKNLNQATGDIIIQDNEPLIDLLSKGKKGEFSSNNGGGFQKDK